MFFETIDKRCDLADPAIVHFDLSVGHDSSDCRQNRFNNANHKSQISHDNSSASQAKKLQILFVFGTLAVRASRALFETMGTLF